MNTNDPLRLEWATEIFLSSMRRSAVKSGSETKVKALTDYLPQQRAMLQDAIRAAISSFDHKMNTQFLDWKLRNDR